MAKHTYSYTNSMLLIVLIFTIIYYLSYENSTRNLLINFTGILQNSYHVSNYTITLHTTRLSILRLHAFRKSLNGFDIISPSLDDFIRINFLIPLPTHCSHIAIAFIPNCTSSYQCSTSIIFV